MEQLLPSGVVDCQGVPLTSAAADLDVGVECGEEEDTRLARAFLMGTSSELPFGGANSVSFQMFRSPETIPRKFASPKVVE